MRTDSSASAADPASPACAVSASEPDPELSLFLKEHADSYGYGGTIDELRWREVSAGWPLLSLCFIRNAAAPVSSFLLPRAVVHPLSLPLRVCNGHTQILSLFRAHPLTHPFCLCPFVSLLLLLSPVCIMLVFCARAVYVFAVCA